MHTSITLTRAESESYDVEDHASWKAARRTFQERAVIAMAGQTGTCEILHHDGTVLDWIQVLSSSEQNATLSE